ncbi:MAG: glycosyltransferase family 4 protein [Verrucomicrobiota bacterium]
MPLSKIHHPKINLANPLPKDARLPKALLYSSAAAYGGVGLANSSLQGILPAYRQFFLGQAIGYGNHQCEVAPSLIRSLRCHPVRALSFLPSDQYYGAKKRYVDWIASRELKTNNYDCFHGWSGDSESSLIVAREKDIPSMIEIPTWHRDKLKSKPFETKSDKETRIAKGWKGATGRLVVGRPRILLEYELADLLLVQSEASAESFLTAGIPPERLFYVSRGVDPEKYPQATPPDHFRLTFVGALIKRKGIHHLLQAWHKLNLKNAELVLVGHAHDEIQPFLTEFKTDSVNLTGFVPDVPSQLSQSSAFVFPSELEGTAKATLEAASCGLPLITTREAGDATVDGHNGIIVPPNNPDALADAIKFLYENPDKARTMGAASRQRVLENFTWAHYHARLLHAYAHLMSYKI